jgi:tetratricopeptide (TPR) repeat protein
MREHQAAIQAFRTALADRSASTHDMLDVLYFLGQSLEFTGQTQEALEVYDRVSQVNPEFRNVADRVKALRLNAEQANQRREADLPNRLGLKRPRGSFWRFLFGGQK